MKRFIFLALLMLLATAAPAQYKVWLANDSSYATSDTTSWVAIDPMRFYSLAFLSTDSCNMELALDYRVANDTTTVATRRQQMGAAIIADSTNITANLGGWKGYVVRDASTDKIPGADLVRLRATRKTTRNGTTKTLYDCFLIRGTGGK